jgi:hypothetical protein
MAWAIRNESPHTVVVVLSAMPQGFEHSGLAAGAVAPLDKCELGVGRLEALWDEHRPTVG